LQQIHPTIPPRTHASLSLPLFCFLPSPPPYPLGTTSPSLSNSTRSIHLFRHYASLPTPVTLIAQNQFPPSSCKHPGAWGSFCSEAPAEIQNCFTRH
jgi:hypothetical protein